MKTKTLTRTNLRPEFARLDFHYGSPFLNFALGLTRHELRLDQPILNLNLKRPVSTF